MTIWRLDAAVARLKLLHGEGYSAGQMAQVLSREFEAVSRNAVIGKASRLGLEFSPQRIPVATPEETYGAARSVVLTDRQKAVDAIAKDPKVIADRAFGGCRWPLYRPADDGQHLICCNERKAKAVYCPGHARLAFQSTRSAEAKANDAATWATNIERSGAQPGATRHFNTSLAVAS
jgi:hypothetical protein